MTNISAFETRSMKKFDKELYHSVVLYLRFSNFRVLQTKANT